MPFFSFVAAPKKREGNGQKPGGKGYSLFNYATENKSTQNVLAQTTVVFLATGNLNESTHSDDESTHSGWD